MRRVTSDHSGTYEHNRPFGDQLDPLQTAIRKHSLFKMGELRNIVIGYSAAILVIITSCVGLATVQILEGAIPDFQLSIYRLFLQSVILFIVCKWNNQLTDFQSTHIKWMLIGVVSYLFYNFGGFGSAKCLPLAPRGAINSLIVFVVMAILFWIYKLQYPGKVNLISMIVCLLGILMIIQPHVIFPKISVQYSLNFLLNVSWFSSDTSHPGWDLRDCDSHHHPQAQTPYCYCLLALGSVGNAVYFFCLGHKLSQVDLSVKLFWVCLGSLLLAFPFTFYLEEINVHFIYCLPQLVLVLTQAVSTCCAVWFTSVALQKLGGLRLAILLTSKVAMELIFQYTFLRHYQPGKHNLLEIGGVIVVIVGMSLPAILECLKGKKGGQNYFEMEDLTHR